MERIERMGGGFVFVVCVEGGGGNGLGILGVGRVGEKG